MSEPRFRINVYVGGRETDQLKCVDESRRLDLEVETSPIEISTNVYTTLEVSERIARLFPNFFRMECAKVIIHRDHFVAGELIRERGMLSRVLKVIRNLPEERLAQLLIRAEFL